LSRVYFGSYTNTGVSQGIYVSRFDSTTGRLSDPELAVATPDPSWLALHPNGRWLLAVNELETLDGRSTGAVSSFAIDDATGRLTFLNRQYSEGASPCHLVITRDGRHALVANYHGGSVAVLPIAPDGTVWPATSVVRHQGRGPHPDRQEGPHAHSIHLDPAERFALAVDLGLDKILVYRFDGAAGTLTPHDPPHATLDPASGPRHLAFHPTGKWLYVDNELANTVTVFDYDGDAGRLTERQTVPTLPPDFKGANTTAEIRSTPDGRFLYVSNRGHDSLAVFATDESTGTLTPRGHVSTEGRTPRHFAIDATGGYLIAANQDADSVIVFRIDRGTGVLAPTGSRAKLPRPVAIICSGEPASS
jgi:6-phosphogluconolactonase